MLKWLIVGLFLVGITGCATTGYYVGIDSINSGVKFQNSRCYIFSGINGTSVDDLFFKEYSGYIKSALISQGYTIAKNPNEADIAIFFSYGISAPKENIASVPMWGQTGYSSSNSRGNLDVFSGSYSGTTTFTPTYGITGSQSINYTTYTRYIILDAYDFKTFVKDHKQIELWKTTIASTGSSGNLREVLPALVVAGKSYFAENLDKPVQVIITDDDKRIQAIKLERQNSGVLGDSN